MRNIRILYIVNSLKHIWLWLGIWILYYQSFGGNSAVGILETVMIVSGILFEIPTGAISDIFGKKISLISGLFVNGIGSIWMAFAPDLAQMIFSLIVMVAGYAMVSGTFEALIFDSLKDVGKESKYNKIISNMTSIQLVTLAIASAIGGYLYQINPGWPNLFTGISLIIAASVSLLLTEPKIDSVIFSFKSYWKQTIQGFDQLFKKRSIKSLTLSLLFIGFVTLIMYEGLNDIMTVEFGFTGIQLGYMASLFSLLGAFFSYISGKLSEKYSAKVLLGVALTIYIFSMILSPFVAMFLGGVTIMLRHITAPVLENQTSVLLNENIESKYRATSLSTYAMIRNLPYALVIYFIAASTDKYPAAWVVFFLGLLLSAGLINFVRVARTNKISNLQD